MDKHALELTHQITELLDESTKKAELDEKNALLIIEIISLIVVVCFSYFGLWFN